MARTAWPTVATSDSWTASQHNTYGRDNDLAYWVYTTAGDVAYATSSSALTRLPIGAAYDVLRTNSGATAPEWSYPRHKFALVSNSGTQTIPATGSYLNVLWNTDDSDAYGWHSTASNTERVIPTVAGFYIGMMQLVLPTAGMPFNIEIYKNNTTLVGAIRSDVRSGFTSTDQVFSYPVSLNGTTDYLNGKIQQNDAGTQTLGASSWFCVWRIE